MNQELIRIIDGIAKDKNIDKESIFTDIESAMISGARKHFGQDQDIIVQIDRHSGDITAYLNGQQIDIKDLGRIPAQTVKQVMIQKIREDERGSIFTEYQDRVGEIVSGSVARYEGGVTIVNLGRTEAILPKSEQIPGESQHPGERVRAVIYEVKESPNQIKITLSRTHPDFIRKLFEQEVPEVSDGIIEIKALSREAGYRSKVAVVSHDNKVDAVGACVGVRGSRIKNIVDELSGEKIDIVRWNESSQIFIGNALRPAEIRETALCFELNRATVVVNDDQLSLAIGKRGQNVRLAARLTDWDIDILTPQEFASNMDTLVNTLREIDGITDPLIDKICAMGIISVMDLEEIGTDPLIETLDIDLTMALRIVNYCNNKAQLLSENQPQKTAAQQVLAGELSGLGTRNRKSDKLSNLLSSEPINLPAQDDEQDKSSSPPPGE